MIYSPSSFHAAYRVSKFKWIVELNLMNKLAFVLNLVFPKHCDATENVLQLFSLSIQHSFSR